MNDQIRSKILEIKNRIQEVEKSDTKLSETDTRQGLINPIFAALGWDFGDFSSVKSELRHKDYNDPVDYAFFSVCKKEKPVLLLEAKTLGTNLDDPKVVKQLCMYLGEMGVQWGCLSDGNKYVMYNSKGGNSFEDQRFLTLKIRDVATEDGLPLDEFAEKMVALLSRECLENDDIQATYEGHMVDTQIEASLQSLLSSPFDSLATAIKNEFKMERVKTNENLKITKKRIIDYLETMADEDGQLPINFGEDNSSNRSDEYMKDAADCTISENNDSKIATIKSKTKLISINDLLKEGLVEEGDNWRLQYKGETFWARVTGNGDLEVNGNIFPNPSRAAASVIHRQSAGWNRWFYKDSEGLWFEVENLRAIFREKHGFNAIRRSRNIEKIAS